MVEFVNMIMRNEDVQGQEEKFGTWKDALDAALYEAENKRMSWAEAKKHKVEVWMHETETDEMEMLEDVPFVRIWNVEINLCTDTWHEFQTVSKSRKIKARNAIEAAEAVVACFNTDDLTDNTKFKVYPVNWYGERIAYMKPVIFDKGDLCW